MPLRRAELDDLLPATSQARWQHRFGWAHMFVPLAFEDRLRGLLIVGPCSSGNVYSDQDTSILSNVARQAALAFVNVQLVEMLRGLTQELVRSDEAHRKRVARDLHDTVLQELFFVKHGLLSREDDEHAALIGGAIATLRRVIRDARPPLLDHGLEYAMRGLVEEMQEMAGDSPVILLHSGGSEGVSLSDEQATALYRIAQEALTNAIKHANADTVTVALETGPGNRVRLRIEDDGAGVFPSAQEATKGEHHYGLMGMQERATMIGAELHFASTRGEGTRIEVCL